MSQPSLLHSLAGLARALLSQHSLPTFSPHAPGSRHGEGWGFPVNLDEIRADARVAIRSPSL